MVCFPVQEEFVMHRFYADPSKSDEHLFYLDAGDACHASRVLRMVPGDQAEVFFGNCRYLAELDSFTENSILFRPLRELPSTEPGLSVTLFQGLPKSDKMDWIVQKAVELGAVRIVPLLLSRCVVRPDAKDLEKKRERWQKIAREAGKQSGRCVIPDVYAPISAIQAAALFSDCSRVVVPWEQCGQGGPVAFVRRNPSLESLGIIIGPEGGISEEEIQYFTDLGCEPVTLGKRILRTETAGLAALSVFFGLYGEME